jgi:hypothetical protein
MHLKRTDFFEKLGTRVIQNNIVQTCESRNSGLQITHEICDEVMFRGTKHGGSLIPSRK